MTAASSTTMADEQLCLPRLLRHAGLVNGRSTVVTQAAASRRRLTFADLAARAGRLGSGLQDLKVGPGTAVATLLFATDRHLECYLAVPSIGAVLHTLNLRMHQDELLHVFAEAGDSLLIVEAELLEPLAEFIAKAPGLRGLIVVGGRPEGVSLPEGVELFFYDDLLRAPASDLRSLPDCDERAPAIVCHSGGTTGLPKGVVYSHRSLWLQALSLCTANSLAIGCRDRLLAAIPLYHVNGWGLPFATLMAGADLLLPGRALQADALLATILEEEPTLAAGIPTLWIDLLELVRARGITSLGPLRRIVTGGAPVPKHLHDGLGAFGISVQQAWGMTETSSMSAISQPPAWAESAADLEDYAARQGRIVCGLEVRLADEAGRLLPHDGESVGEVLIRGPWVTERYLAGRGGDGFVEGWLKTGDLGRIDADGYLSLTDRAKDAIKSGGEWIPSLVLEEAIRSCAGIGEVAVIAIPDPRWQERPLALLVPDAAGTPDLERLAEALREVVPRWWVPEAWALVEALPRTTIGKFDKKAMRAAFAAGRYELRRLESS
ncbi:MAG: long-chain fatty acid--CoA ligase [Rhodospirillales bacterium]